MKKKADADIILIVALGKAFNNTSLTPEECNLVCSMTLLQLVKELCINESQALLLKKWANKCSQESSQDEKDIC